MVTRTVAGPSARPRVKATKSTSGTVTWGIGGEPPGVVTST